MWGTRQLLGIRHKGKNYDGLRPSFRPVLFLIGFGWRDSGVPLARDFYFQLLTFMELNQIGQINPRLLLVLLYSRRDFLAGQ
jgi:hypothetical protein